jgi:hydrogenase maturation protein HypF
MKSAPSTEFSSDEAPARSCVRIMLQGAVQGVGFRPFVFRVARELGVTGWVGNSRDGVTIEAEGDRESLDRLIERIRAEKPRHAEISDLQTSFGPCAGFETFQIRESEGRGAATATILADLATCPDCRAEIFDPANRRHRYPFTNCTQCGPRFSIIKSLPYDRANTSMSRFEMCPECSAEYHDPTNRRFHAQPNACPRCGPRVALWNESGLGLADDDEAMGAAARLLKEGAIVALKGIGGFQLLVDASNEEAVRRLRLRKCRPEKPFAVMFPTLEAVAGTCVVPDGESTLLTSAAAPIVLVKRRADDRAIAPSVAPSNPQLGVMLPYSPLHHLLMADVGIPLVATSGNRSDEPICTDESEALGRLKGVADYFLVHNRPIVRPVDDSVARVLLGRGQILRRARGQAPLPIRVADEGPSVIGLGADMKNTVALSVGRNIFISQHLGDLETPQARSAFQGAVSDLPRLYGVKPVATGCDLHPGYASSRYARWIDAQACGVQHHYAHVLACMAEHGLGAPVLGICWDGTGFGTDGTIWGGEFLAVGPADFRRVAHFHPFPLTGGDAAAREPRRSALGVLHETYGDGVFSRDNLASVQAFSRAELRILRQALLRGVNTAVTSSAGRLFDAVSSLAGLRQLSSFEGQAAMDLEFAMEAGSHSPYPFTLTSGDPCEFDWRPTIRAVLEDIEAGSPAGRVAARFHETLSEVIVAVATRIGIDDIALTGGCFQNRWLAETAARRLHQAGFKPHWPQRVPPNDGGIALGQVLAARRAWLEPMDTAEGAGQMDLLNNHARPAPHS